MNKNSIANKKVRGTELKVVKYLKLVIHFLETETYKLSY